MTIFTDVADAIHANKTDEEIYSMHSGKNKGKVRRAIDQLRKRIGKMDPGRDTITRIAPAYGQQRQEVGYHAVGAGVRMVEITLPRVKWLERKIVE